MFFPETRNHSDFDRQVSMLRNKVEVMKDARSYLISISFSARSPDEAARIVNTIALEYLRDKTIRRRADVVMAAEGELARQMAIAEDQELAFERWFGVEPPVEAMRRGASGTRA